MEKRVRCVAELPQAPQIQDWSALSTLIDSMSQGHKSVAEKMSVKVSADQALCTAEDALRRWASANPLCPVCGGQVDPEQLLLMGVHDHGRV
jgi:hypothetical protein